MTDSEAKNIETVRRYFDGCQSGDMGTLLSTLTQDVVHYFLPSRFHPIRGAEMLATHWHKFKVALDPVWAIDRIIAQGNEVVSEWSCIWTPRKTKKRLLWRGSEWYVMRDAKIAEVRAYLIYDEHADVQLTDFPYVERGYLAMR
jgi:ketosteroid isomerase-like protein